jgi:hypothetical protein
MDINMDMNINNSIDSAEAEIDQIINNSLVEPPNLPKVDMIDANMASNNEILGTVADTIESTTTPEEDEARIEVFNTALHQYLRINEEIKSLMLAIKERNDIKRKLGDTLSNYLKAKQIKKVNLDGRDKGKRLEVEVKTTNTGFNKTSVTEALLSELQDETELFDKIMRAISKTSVLKEVWKLKVTEEKAARTAATSGCKKSKGRKLGTSMADAAALIDDDDN